MRYWIFLVALVCGCSYASEGERSFDHVLAPYFFVHSDDPQADRLPLKRTDVDVQISGVIAQVKVVQHYRNEGTRPLEAQYVFPGSTRSAVYGLTMTIGERKVEAQIRRKEQARVEYQEAKTQGKSAALLEQQRPNVFTMNVANIMPKDDIAVELRYTEILIPTDSVYEFVFPTVVGPRYSTTAANTEPPIAQWQSNPYLLAGEAPTSDFDIHVALNSGIAIKEVASTSHKVEVQYSKATHADVALSRDERNSNNRDYILDYRLAGDAVESGLLLYSGGDENFFAATIEPPRRVRAADIPARDYIFVVDVSGSMAGFPLNTAKTLLRELVHGLKPTDSFNVVLFAGVSNVLSPTSLPASEANVTKAVAFIDAAQGGGGTELLKAMRRALALPVASDDRARSIVVVTDGYVDVEKETFELIGQNRTWANVFAFGIGTDVNRYLIEGMAHAGHGEPFIVTSELTAAVTADRFRHYIESPVLTHITLEANGFDIEDVVPMPIADVLAERPIVVIGKWRGKARGRLTLRGVSGSGPYERAFDVGAANSDKGNEALKYLWARQRISDLGDFEKIAPDSQRAEQITQLGLKYSLLTAYTSFLAVDRVVRNTRPEDTESVKQPLPMPQGVENSAVGGQIPTSPEPEFFVLVGVAGALVAWRERQRRRRAALAAN